MDGRRGHLEAATLAPAIVRFGQATGVLATAFLAGQTASITYLHLPVLLSSTSPRLLLRQWSIMLHMGHKLTPPIIAILSTLFTWLASREAIVPDPGSNSFLKSALRTLPRRGRAYAAAALVLPLVVPYTMFIMRPVHSVLLAREQELDSTFNEGFSINSTERERKQSIVSDDSPDAGFGLFGSPARAKKVEPAPQTRAVDATEGSIVYQRTTFAQFLPTTTRRNEDMTAHELVDKWGWLNLGRAGIVAAGACFAAWALVI